jgi:hypothetical protein
MSKGTAGASLKTDRDMELHSELFAFMVVAGWKLVVVSGALGRTISADATPARVSRTNWESIVVGGSSVLKGDQMLAAC